MFKKKTSVLKINYKCQLEFLHFHYKHAHTRESALAHQSRLFAFISTTPALESPAHTATGASYWCINILCVNEPTILLLLQYTLALVVSAFMITQEMLITILLGK